MGDDLLHTKVEQHGQEINRMAVAVAEVTQIVKGVEKRHDESMTTIRDAMGSIQKLFEKDVAALKGDVSDLKAEYRIMKHDIGEIKNTNLAIPIMDKQLTENKTKIENIENWKNKIAGGTEASRIWVIVLWAIFGTGIISLGAFFLKEFFHIGGIDVPVQ